MLYILQVIKILRLTQNLFMYNFGSVVHEMYHTRRNVVILLKCLTLYAK